MHSTTTTDIFKHQFFKQTEMMKSQLFLVFHLVKVWFLHTGNDVGVNVRGFGLPKTVTYISQLLCQSLHKLCPCEKCMSLCWECIAKTPFCTSSCTCDKVNFSYPHILHIDQTCWDTILNFDQLKWNLSLNCLSPYLLQEISVLGFVFNQQHKSKTSMTSYFFIG